MFRTVSRITSLFSLALLVFVASIVGKVMQGGPSTAWQGSITDLFAPNVAHADVPAFNPAGDGTYIDDGSGDCGTDGASSDAGTDC